MSVVCVSVRLCVCPCAPASVRLCICASMCRLVAQKGFLRFLEGFLRFVFVGFLRLSEGLQCFCGYLCFLAGFCVLVCAGFPGVQGGMVKEHTAPKNLPPAAARPAFCPERPALRPAK